MSVRKFHRASIGAGVSALALLAFTAPAAAQTTEELLELIRKQSAQIEAMQQRIDALEQRGAPAAAPSSQATPAATPAPVAAAPSGQPDVKVQWKGAPELSSADGNFTAKLRGRVQSDYWGVSSSTDGVDYPSGSTLRAIRLGVEGKLSPLFAYKAEVDFTGDGTTVKDAYLRYLGVEGWSFTVGNQKPLFSLENMTGLPRTTFMERALPNVFAFSESIGFSAATSGDNWSFGVTAFGETPGTELDRDEGYGIAGRATFAPIAEKTSHLHVGVSGYHKKLNDQTLRVRQRPEVRVFGTRLVDTRDLNADTSSAAGVELAGGFGPFSAQGEYIWNWVDLDVGGTAKFDGAYVQASWFVTGESRPYEAKSGTHGRLRPAAALGEGGIGAFEVAARFSTLDLNDGLIRGGKEENFTLGLNWYPTSYTRLAFNWVHFDVDGSLAASPYTVPDHKGNAFGVRAQVDW